MFNNLLPLLAISPRAAGTLDSRYRISPHEDAILGQLISPACSTSYIFLGVRVDELIRLLYPSYFIHSVVSVWQRWRRAMMAAQVDGERDLRGCHEGDVQLLIVPSSM
jgi:hypothetical protein